MGCRTRRDFRRVGIDAADIGCFGPMKSEPRLHAVEVPKPQELAASGVAVQKVGQVARKVPPLRFAPVGMTGERDSE